MMAKVTAPWCIQAKKEGKKITMLTAYDALLAKMLDDAEIDLLLVGDSLGMVVQGKNDTLGVTMDEMVYHTKMVSRVTRHAMVIGDMPFMSFQGTVEEAFTNAGRLIKEGGANAIKLEGGKAVLPQVRAIVKAGIPVMGHLGLTPQSVNEFGGFKIQAKSEQAVQRLISDALALEDAGVFAIVLEAVPVEAAKRVTNHVRIPTIGIGAGPHCDGQVLVTYDMLGMTETNIKFVKQYALIREIILDSAKKYKQEVLDVSFPTQEFSYNLEIEDSIPTADEEMETYIPDDEDVFDDLF